MKIKFYSCDDLPLNKSLKFHAMTIIIRSVFQEDGQLYPQLFLEKIDISEVIDVNKTSLSKECMLCHYWYFKDVGFKFEEHVCNGWHDLLTMAYVSENIVILSTKRATFRCILWGISRNEGLRRLNILC